jgi:hypothetical protein
VSERSVGSSMFSLIPVREESCFTMVRADAPGMALTWMYPLNPRSIRRVRTTVRSLRIVYSGSPVMPELGITLRCSCGGKNPMVRSTSSETVMRRAVYRLNAGSCNRRSRRRRHS